MQIIFILVDMSSFSPLNTEQVMQQTFFQESELFQNGNRPFCISEPPFGGLEAAHAVHIRLIGKPVVGVLLVIMNFLSLGVTAEVLRADIDWKSAFLSDRVIFAQNFRYTGSSATKYFSCQKTRRIGLLYGIRILAEVSFILSQFTRLTDRETERQTEISCIISPVKTKL